METLLTKPRTAREHFERRLERLRLDRQTWVSACVDLARYFAPQYDRFEKRGQRNLGDASFDAILDNTGTQAAEIFAEGVMSGASNKATRWFRIAIWDQAMMRDPAVRGWLDESTRVMQEVMGRSNFYQTLLRVYFEYGLFGTACAILDDDEEDLIRGHNFAPGEYFLAADSRGQVDTCYREFTLTCAQAIAQFGVKNVSEQVKNSYEHGDVTRPVEVIHAIEPVDGTLDEIDRRLPAGSRWRSCYLEQATGMSKPPAYLRASGYIENPIWAPRMHRVSTDTYGYGRGHVALGDVKQLQDQTLMKTRAIENETDPPLKGPAGLRNKGAEFNPVPGGVTWYPDGSDPKAIDRLFAARVQMQYVLEDIAQLRDRIERAFYKDVFSLFSNMVQGELRVEQVRELREEKVLRMGGVFSPLDDDVYDPAIKRVFGICLRAGQLPPMPEQLQGVGLRIVYDNVLTQAQKAQGLAGIDRIYGTAGNIAAIKGGDPGAFDKLDDDAAMDEYADLLGVPQKILISTEQAQAARQQRAMLQQAAMAAKAGKDAAGIAKTLSETPTEGESYLNRMAGAYSQYAA